MKRVSLYVSIGLVFSLCFETNAAGILRQRVAQAARVVSCVPMRHASTKVSANSPERGVCTQATEDPIFKYMMQNDEVRNSFLTGVIGETVTDSELMDLSLNPMRSYTGLRSLLNSQSTQTMMETLKESDSDDIVVSRASTKRKLPKVTEFLKELSSHYAELIYALPDGERNTQMDLLCQTESGLGSVSV